MNVFIAESNGAKDFYEWRLDGYAANETIGMSEIQSTYKIIINKKMLIRAVREAVSQNVDIFQLSCHGNDDGLQLADGEDLDWVEMTKILMPLAATDRILIYASCAGGHQRAAEAFQKVGAPFGYVCGSSANSVGFHDSCIAWSVLYNVLATHNCRMADQTEVRTALREAIKKINSIVPGKFCYRRWDGTKYKRYVGMEA